MSMNPQQFNQIPGDTLPQVPGDYITNFGRLKFDGTTFLMVGHRKPTPTTVEWWLKKVENSGGQKILDFLQLVLHVYPDGTMVSRETINEKAKDLWLEKIC